jgi:hypothetical protein
MKHAASCNSWNGGTILFDEISMILQEMEDYVSVDLEFKKANFGVVCMHAFFVCTTVCNMKLIISGSRL